MNNLKSKIFIAFILIICIHINATIFNPYPGANYVPISEFQKLENPFEASSFIIKREVYNYIRNANKSIGISVLTSTNERHIITENINIDTVSSSNNVIISVSISQATGQVLSGYMVAITNAFSSHLPISTHWDSSLSVNIFGKDIKGGFRKGATDGISLTGSMMNTAPFTQWGDKYWNTNEYNLFDNSSHLYWDNMKYEHYIGEEYSFSSISDVSALSFSNKFLIRFGYPIVFKNFTNENNITIDLEENLPAFQILNGVIMKDEDEHGAISTYIVPPFWNRNSDPYPVLFTDFYDLNGTVFGFSGERILNAIGKLDSLGYGTAIGVVTNSGSSYGSFGLNETSFKNMINITNCLKTEFNADVNNIIAFGSSRGGVFSLALASNPLNVNNYNVKFALTFSPGVKIGDILLDYTNPTYPALNYCLDYTVGYKGMWHDKATLPNLPLSPLDSIYSRDYFCHVITGTDLCVDKSNYDTHINNLREELNNRFFIGDATLQKLQSEGTKVVMVNGTHDGYFNYAMFAEFEAKLKARGIPLRHEIIYSGGHCSWATTRFDEDNYLTTLLKLIKTNNINGFSAFEGTHHYDNNNNPIYPTRQPVFFEGPVVAFPGKKASFTIVGPPGTEYKLQAYKINDNLWINNDSIKIENSTPINVVNPGTLPSNCQNGDPIPNMSWISKYITISEGISTGYYIYDLLYKAPGDQSYKRVSATPNAYKKHESHEYSVKTTRANGSTACIVKIVAEEPMLSGYELKYEYGNNGGSIGWGLLEK